MADFPDYFKNSSPPEIKQRTPNYFSESIGLKQFVRQIPAHQWQYDIGGFVLKKDIGKFDAWLFSLKGRYKTFTYKPDEQHMLPDSTPSPVLVASASIGDDTVDVTQLSEVTEDDAGFFIRFVGDTKLYMVSSVSKESGFDRLTIVPQLLSDKSLGGIVDYTPEMTVRLETDVLSGNSSRNSQFKTYRMTLVEAL